MDFIAYSQESLRIVANLEQRYDAWIDAVRTLDALPSSMFFATSDSGRQFLTVKRHAKDNGTSVGPREPDTERRLAEYETARRDSQGRLRATGDALTEIIALYRRLRLPVAMPLPAKILRELDIAQLLGRDLMLVGTNAFIAYQLEAGHRFPEGVGETEDFDMAWCRGAAITFSSTTQPAPPGKRDLGSPLMRVLRAVDPSFKINPRRPYQARDKSGYEVELLSAPSLFRTFSKDEVFSPVATLEEQEWLLKGRPVRHIAISQDNKPCPLFVPDPRWMALHKLWLAEKPERSAAKRPKDRLQGDMLLDAVQQFMSSAFPLDSDFILDLPDVLRPHFDRWCAERNFVPGKAQAALR